MDTKINKNYILLIFIIIIGILLSAGYFFVAPKYKDYIKIKKEFDLKDNDLQAKQDYLSKLKAVSERLAGFSNQIANIESALPIEPSIAALFNYLQKTAAENGMIIGEIDVAQLFSVQETDENINIKEMPFSMNVSGSYSAFKNFLEELYLSARIIEIVSIDFVPSETLGIFDFDLELKTHSYNNNKNSVLSVPLESKTE